jgi:hypothetical protein
MDAPIPFAGALEDRVLPGVEDVARAARYLARY